MYSTTLMPLKLNTQVQVEVINSPTEAQVMLVQSVVFLLQAAEIAELHGRIEMGTSIVTTDECEAFYVLVANFTSANFNLFAGDILGTALP